MEFFWSEPGGNYFLFLKNKKGLLIKIALENVEKFQKIKSSYCLTALQLWVSGMLIVKVCQVTMTNCVSNSSKNKK